MSTVIRFPCEFHRRVDSETMPCGTCVMCQKWRAWLKDPENVCEDIRQICMALLPPTEPPPSNGDSWRPQGTGT